MTFSPLTKTDILNRIDDPPGCKVIIEHNYGGIIEYCDNDEYHPFSGLCEAHTPEGYPFFPAFYASIHPERIKCDG